MLVWFHAIWKNQENVENPYGIRVKKIRQIENSSIHFSVVIAHSLNVESFLQELRKTTTFNVVLSENSDVEISFRRNTSNLEKGTLKN